MSGHSNHPDAPSARSVSGFGAIPRPLIAFVRASATLTPTSTTSTSTSTSTEQVPVPSPSPRSSIATSHTSTSTSSRKRGRSSSNPGAHTRSRSLSTGSLRALTALPQQFTSTRPAHKPPVEEPIKPIIPNAPRPRSNRSKARITRAIESTLLALLVSLQNERIRVELRNETEVRGRLDYVAFDMTLRMSGVTCKPMQRPVEQHDLMFIKGPQIRYVHIPDHVDVAKQLTVHEAKLAAARTMYQRKKNVASAPASAKNSNTSTNKNAKTSTNTAMETTS